MAHERDAQKTFLTWEESAEILLTDASLGEVFVNAHAVRLFDNGTPINLERHTTADMARVNVK